MQHKRFILAIAISAIILFAWSYFVPQKPIKPDNSNQAANAQPTATATPVTQPSVATTPATPQPQAVTPSVNTTPQRSLVVETPLYEAKFDSKGAIATSWIIKMNKGTGTPEDPPRPLYSVGGDRNSPKPLQLISQEGLKQDPVDAPFGLITGDDVVDKFIVSNNYRIDAGTGDESEIRIDLKSGEKTVDFVLHDDATGLDVMKRITFKADYYDVGLETKVTRTGNPLPKTQLVIGPSIGDQGVAHYSFYSVAPEGIGVVNGEVKRLLGTSIHTDEEGWIFKTKRPEGPNRHVVNGEVDWAGVGDTYFAMIVVPVQKPSSIEYRTIPYKFDAGGKAEDRFLLSAMLPVPADGAKMLVYFGPKDHYQLTAASAQISGVIGRPVDLEQSIDYGLFSTLSRPLAVPILWCIKKLYHLTGSYGIAIILFTIVIYSLFFPLKWRSSKSMKKAQKLAPRMKELQEKLKGMKQTDPRMKELQSEQLRLMREGNPLGGCLPLLIQMPFLFALYRAITISIDFRQASFLWIPDLSAPEPFFIHFLPIAMAASMIVLQLITPQPSADPLQRKMMAIGMPIFMLYILWSAPAGLLVYWLVGNLVGFGQQFLINRLTKSTDDEEPPAVKKPQTSRSRKLSTAKISQA